MKKFISLTLLSVCYTTFLLAQSSTLWGTCGWGGAMGWGAIVKGNSDGTNFQSVYSFDNTNGAEPMGGLCMANNGHLYGVTYLGGYGDSCVCFEYDTATGVYTKFYDLYLDQTQGWGAQSAMLNASDGMLYGLCGAGGNNGAGVIYRIDPATNTYNAIHHFTTADGAGSTGELIQLSDGKLYGTSGGSIFSYDITNSTFNSLYSFSPATGNNPRYGHLLKANDGKLYGLTLMGGAYDYPNSFFIQGNGVLFSFDLSTGIYTDLHDFNGADGLNPNGSLIQASDGNLYGTTNSGGSAGYGVIFKYNIPSHTCSVVYEFNGLMGSFPQRSLTQGSCGKLFGTTVMGGANNNGVFFSFDIINHSYNVLINCTPAFGTNPQCDIIETGVTQHINAVFTTNVEKDLTIFPSPASKEISITGNSISINDIVTVTDVTGREVLQQKAAQSQHVNLNVALLTAGIYFAEVKMQSGIAVKRFVKE